MDILPSLTAAINIAKQLKEYNDKIKDAQFGNLLADLSLELAEIKSKLADVTIENSNLKKELHELKQQKAQKKTPFLKNGLYYVDEDGPFCTACYDDKNKFIRLKDSNPDFKFLGELECPACKNFYHSKSEGK